MSESCVFCRIVVGSAPATVVREWGDALAFLPVPNPVTDGHTLVIPTRHISSAASDPLLAGTIAARAAELAADMRGPDGDGPEDFHLIVNSGPDAGQSVFHLHWHIVPRRPGDKLLMPWDATPSHLARLLDSCTAWHEEVIAGRGEIDRLRHTVIRLRRELGEVDADQLAERTEDAKSGQDGAQ